MHKSYTHINTYVHKYKSVIAWIYDRNFEGWRVHLTNRQTVFLERIGLYDSTFHKCKGIYMFDENITNSIHFIIITN